MLMHVPLHNINPDKSGGFLPPTARRLAARALHQLPLATISTTLCPTASHLPYDASALGDLGPPQLKARLTGGQAFAHTVTQPGALPDVTQFRGKEAAQVAADKVRVTEADRQVSRGDQVVGGSYFNQAGF